MAATNDPDLVWSSTLDNRFIIRVERTGDYTADLVIIDNGLEGDPEVLREATGLSYRALFGPDVDDVATWQARAIKFVDEGV
jgi:hypothetical protein